MHTKSLLENAINTERCSWLFGSHYAFHVDQRGYNSADLFSRHHQGYSGVS